MYYLIRKNSDVRFSALHYGEEQDLGSSVLPKPKVFKESWFKGYKKCACCDETVALFLFDVHENGDGTQTACYLQTDAENVREFACKTELEAALSS